MNLKIWNCEIFCDSPATSGLASQKLLNNLGFQDPASPLMEGLIALHSDVWAIMLFVAGFVLYVLIATLYTAPSESYKVHHHSLIEIVWTTVPALILCLIAIPSFTLLYSLDEIVEPSLTVKAIGRQWYWSAPFNGDLDWNSTQTSLQNLILSSHSAVLSVRTAKYSTYLTLTPQGNPGGLNKPAERLRGPQHVEKGRLNQKCLGKYAVRTKSVMVTKSIVSGIHTSPQVDIKELKHRLRPNKSNVQAEQTGMRSLRQVGPRASPKAPAKPNHWNSGLAKAGNGYANGDLVVVRYFNEGGQFKTLELPYVDTQYTLGKSKSQPFDLNLTQTQKFPKGNYKTLLESLVYKIAYDQIKSKQGYTTPGVDKQTLDGIGLAWIDEVIKRMKDRSFQFQPALRKFIPKPNGKLRPLGIPTPKDKVVQQALRLILEPLFEPNFLNSSHGFRPHRSAHTALREIKSWSGITWMLEGDIKGCFDNIDHRALEKLLKRQVKDQNIIGLYWKAVNAGYVNNGNLERHSLTGVPQGGVLSPLLSNVYLHELDKFVETLKVKHQQSFNRRGSKQNPVYTAKLKELKELRTAGDGKAIRKAEFERRSIPSVIRTSTRIYYVRYADDWVIGVKGPKALAETVKTEVEAFLRSELKLELSQEKTKLTHLPSEKAHFLGTVLRRHSPSYAQNLVRKLGRKTERGANVRILLECPINQIVLRLEDQGYIHADGQPKAVTKWISMKPEEIITRYNAVLRGYLNYYSFANNRNMLQRIVWILRLSAVFTLARKWNISPKQVFQKLGKNLSFSVELKDQEGKGNRKRTYALDLGNLRVRPMKFDLIASGPIVDPEKLLYI